MKQTLLAAVVAAGMLTFLSSEASAWVCNARGETGATGLGSHPSSLAEARRRALAQCRIRTPREATCYLTGCRAT